MQRNLNNLANDSYDILVVGGGISGAFIAWDAALRGFKTALIEKADFGGATSAASSKLLHGGVRYLQQAHFSKVRESALERAHYQFMAPHHSHYIPFLVPTYKSFMKSKFVLSSAMRVYSLLCAGEKSIIGNQAKVPPPIQSLSKTDALAIAPYIDRPDLTGAVTLPESHMHSSERMTLSVIKSAVAAGAEVANYVRAKHYVTKQKSVQGCVGVDELTGDEFEINAKLTINAAGPWIPMLDKEITHQSVTSGYARGSHIVVSNIEPDHAIALATKHGADSVVDRGGRHVFIIPWRNRALIGTSYSSCDSNLDAIHVTDEDIAQLVDSINDAAPEIGLTRDHVDYAYCGLYPLQANDIKPGVYQGTGEYQLFDHFSDMGINGLISALGAKFTTARHLGELTVDMASNKLGRGTKTMTKSRRLVGGDINDLGSLQTDVKQKVTHQKQAEHLVNSYGTQALEVVKDSAINAEVLSANQPVTLAEVEYILKNEMALRLDDVLFRRTGLGTVGHPGVECVNMVAEKMASHLGWDGERTAAEVAFVHRRWQYESLSS